MLRIFIFLLFLNAFTYAKSYALVIGVNGNNLIGASNDAYYMERLLKKKRVKNITLLRNEKATKKAIKKNFKEIVKKAKKGDWVYLFFSGHGSNKNDPSINWKLRKKLANTGALQPYGMRKVNYNNLLVIKRDFLKLFQTLDKHQVNTVIMFDACFSGSSYKDFFNTNTKGHLSVYLKPTRNHTNFPYSHIIYLSASTKLAVAAESAKHKRGYFSMALTSCLDHNHKLNTLRSCINKNYFFKATVLPKRGKKTIFSKSAKKDVVVAKIEENLKERLLSLAVNQPFFQIYTKNETTQKLSRSYSREEKLLVYINSEKDSGYLVVFLMNKSGKLKMMYPRNTRLPYTKALSNKPKFRIKAKPPFGEEDLVAFLVDKTSAKKLQKIGTETRGLLKEDKDIQKVIDIIQSSQYCGSHFSVLSQEK